MIPALKSRFTVALASASQSGAATRSVNIDCLGCDYATFKVNGGAAVNTSAATVAIVLKESDDTTATNFATWSSTFSLGKSFITAHQEIMCVDLKTRKRYIQLSISNGTHTTNDVFTAGADVVLQRKELAAAGTAALLGSTNDAVVVG